MVHGKITDYFSGRNTKAYWDRVYEREISEGRIRIDQTLVKLLPLLQHRKKILDFGSGPGGNVKLLSKHLTNTAFYLTDISTQAIAFARNKYLGTSDDHGNTFTYLMQLSEVDGKFEAIMAIEVLEHIKDYSTVLQQLFSLLIQEGILIISVPVKGWRDRHREHRNKFTVKSMFEILSDFSEWVHISPRTYSRRSGRLSTAFFYVIKNKE